MYVLDSSAIIEVLQQRPRAAKMESVIGEETLVTTSITMHEVLLGALSEKERFVLETLFSGMRVLEHDARAAKLSSRIEIDLIRTGKKIGSRDCLIAGICMANDSTLVSLDNDYKRIPGLKVKMF